MDLFMKTLSSLLLLVCANLLIGCSSGGEFSDPNGNNNGVGNGNGNNNSAIETGPFKVLVFSRTVGFRHDAAIPVGIQTIQELGAANQFSVDATEDPTVFNTANLQQYRAIIFLNTTSTTDLQILNPAQQQAMEAFVNNGGGFVGVHSAADTGYNWPFYAELIGAYFKSHPVQQNATLNVEATDHPSTTHLPRPWMLFDELYSFQRSPRGTVRVLLSIDERSYLQNPNTSCLPNTAGFPNSRLNGTMGDHPMSWCHDKFAGRAWYTAFGHEVGMYQLAAYRVHLLNGILTATRRVLADCTPRDPIPPEPTPDPPQLCTAAFP